MLGNSPNTQTLHEAETHSFGVYAPQTYNSHQYIWNTSGTNNSDWKKKVNGNTPTSQSSNTTVNYITTWNELGTITYTAY